MRVLEAKIQSTLKFEWWQENSYISTLCDNSIFEFEPSNVLFLAGRPTPRVTWWRDHALLDDVSEMVDEAAGVVTNELRLVQLRRSDLHSILTCQASNNNISVPASTSVKLDMHCECLYNYILREGFFKGLFRLGILLQVIIDLKTTGFKLVLFSLIFWPLATKVGTLAACYFTLTTSKQAQAFPISPEA